MKRLSRISCAIALVAVVSLLAGNAYAVDSWAAGVSYSTGADVTYGTSPNNLEYQCRQAHTSQVGWEPPNVHALWERPTPPNCFGWSTQTKYVVGSLVVYGPAAYKCIQAHNSEDNWTPPNTPALWSLVDSSSCSTTAADTFEQGYNNPAHYSDLFVTTSSNTTSATFFQSNRQLKADLTFSSPSQFSFGFFVSNEDSWQSFGSATPSGASFDTTVMTSVGLEKDSVIMALGSHERRASRSGSLG